MENTDHLKMHGTSGCIVASHLHQILMTLLVKCNKTLIPDKKDSFLKVSLKLLPLLFLLKPGKKKIPIRNGFQLARQLYAWMCKVITESVTFRHNRKPDLIADIALHAQGKSVALLTV